MLRSTLATLSRSLPSTSSTSSRFVPSRFLTNTTKVQPTFSTSSPAVSSLFRRSFGSSSPSSTGLPVLTPRAYDPKVDYDLDDKPGELTAEEKADMEKIHQYYQDVEIVKTEQDKIQAEWVAWEQAKINSYVIALTAGCTVLVVYWYRKEIDHFYHHRFERIPYPYFIDRTANVAAGWWPGRHCQFFEFNCYSMAYDHADQLLKEKRGEATEKAHH